MQDKNHWKINKEVLKVWKIKNKFNVLVYHRKKIEPAVFYTGGVGFYFFNGMEYNLFEDGKLVSLTESATYPKVIWKNGTKEWLYKNLPHRDDDLPAIEHSNGDREWWFLGKRHRENGPAVVYKKKKYWFEFGNFKKEE